MKPNCIICIKSLGEITKSKAQNRLYHYANKDELRIIVETLEEAKKIEVVTVGKTIKYKLIGGIDE